MNQHFRVITFLLVILFIPTFVGKAETNTLSLHSESVILINKETGELLYEIDSEKKMYPASITKIITGIIAIEDGDLDEIVTVSQEATEVIGTRVYLVKDEQIPLLKVVKGLLINSGNDAGTVIAEYLDGSEEAFAKRMNSFAKRIGALQSNFTNPHGLFDENHYTTAKDMALITQYAMNNELFREIVGTKEIEWNGQEWQTTLYNHHRLLWDYEGTTGVKNGYVRRSGYTLVTSAQKGDLKLLAVTLNSPSAKHAYADTTTLFDYGFQNYTTKNIAPGQILASENGTRYVVTEPIAYTARLDESPKETVTNEGILTVLHENGEVILTRPLLPIDRRQVYGDTEEVKMALSDMIEENKQSTNVFRRFVDYLLSFFK